MKICKTYSFEAAHRLQNHPGKCRFLHGHSYRIDVEIAGVMDPYTGMVLDFDALDKAIGYEVRHSLDHVLILERGDPLVSVLNAEMEENMRICLLEGPPTAEQIAKEFFGRWRETFPCIERVRVWETAKCWAEFSRSDDVP